MNRKAETNPTQIAFSNNPLDRASALRTNPEWLEEQRTSSSALFIPLWQLQPLIFPELKAGDGRDAGWLPYAGVKAAMHGDSLVVFLGINARGKPLFALDVSSLDAPDDNGPFKGLGGFEDLRELAAMGDIATRELAIMAQAKAILDWNLRHPYCSQCATATAMVDGGYKRICAACNSEHFPRTDPVVIMLAVKDDQCLIGRGKDWPEGMFSALAGFIEPGETIEEAVAREVMEETGIAIHKVQYVESQPWPFPASLMIGCIAEAKTQEIKIDATELEDARWVSREALNAAFKADMDVPISETTPPFRLPPKMAIAHRLIKHFATQS